MQGLAIFSAYIIEVHGDFECISIRGPMLTGSKRPRAGHGHGSSDSVMYSKLLLICS